VKAPARFVSTVNRLGFGFGEVVRAAATSAPSHPEGTRAPSIFRRGGLAALLALAVFAALAPAAPAALAPGYGPIGSFDPGTIGYLGPGHIAVDDVTGNILLADSANSAVDVLAPDLSPGGTASTLTQFAVTHPLGLAVDQSTHAVYVSQGSMFDGETIPGNKIERFVSDGAPVPTYMLDPTFTAIGLDNSLSDDLSPLAVDPATHDLLVGERDHVSRYSSTGVLLGTVDGSTSLAGKFRHILDLAAGPDGLYVVDYKGPPGSPSAGDGTTRIVQFDPAGTYLRTLNATDTPTAAAIDPTLDRLIAGGRTGVNQGGAQLSVFDGPDVGGVANAAAAGSYLTGIAVDGGGTGRAYVAVSGSDTGVHVFIPAPGARADSLTSGASRSATFTGLVNPEGKETTAKFEYCGQREPCATDAALPWTQVPLSAPLTDPPGQLGAGSADIPVQAEVTGLVPHTAYRVRIAAEDTQASDFSPDATVTTADEAPISATGPATAITAGGSTLTGSVTPLGVQSTYYFEYGTTASYGARTSEGVLGNGFDPRPVSRVITGLQPGTTYHYRVVGVSAAGVSPGEDRSFTTEQIDGGVSRAYEMVSPVDKQGVPVDTGFGGVRVSDDGNSLMYGTAKTGFPDAEAVTFVPRVLSSRSATGWATTSLDQPVDNLGAGGELFFSTLSVSADVRKALIFSRKKLTPDAVEGGANLYIRNLDASLPSAAFTLVASDPRLAALVGATGSFHMVGTSDDLTVTAFSDGLHVYEAVLGVGIRLASVMPDGTPAVLPSLDPANLLTDPHQISTDGSRVYLNIGNGGSPLYLREDGSKTIPISVSHRPGAPTTPVIGAFLGASPDGRYVEFVTTGGQEGLTPEAPDAGDNAYVYDVETDSLTYLASDVSANYSSVPRPALGALFYQATSGAGLFYAHDGTTTKVAEPNGPATVVRASDNGAYLAFINNAKLTSYDNGGLNEVYLYDTQTGDLSCPSCRPDGGPTAGQVQMGTDNINNSILARYKPRAILDDGRVFFDTIDPLVGADVNGTRDVYSYRAGAGATLISRGKLPTSSQFAEVTPDGSDVFFTTDDRLVAQDEDTTTDMYDARIGGGIASQNSVPRSECVGEDCRGTVAPSPTAPSAGTEAAGPGNRSVHHKKKTKKHHKKHHSKKSGKKHQRVGRNHGGSK
jgi:hypothetical protein